MRETVTLMKTVLEIYSVALIIVNPTFLMMQTVVMMLAKVNIKYVQNSKLKF